MSRLFLLTAPSGAGKTTFCAALADRAHLAGWDVAGVLSPPVFEEGEKVGILVRNLRTGETRPLAIAASRPGNLLPHDARLSPDASRPTPDASRPTPHASRLTLYDLSLGHWLFSSASLAWGNDFLANSLPADLFIVDEIGPLELVRGKGWTNALQALRSQKYRLALVVIRPSLLEPAQALFPEAEVLTLPFDVAQILALL